MAIANWAEESPLNLALWVDKDNMVDFVETVKTW